MGNGLVSIFESPSMRLLDKRSLTAEGICEFQWSPKTNILAYWAPELPNSPIRGAASTRPCKYDSTSGAR